MFKISITGKAKSGKNTVAKLLVKELKNNKPYYAHQFIAFADPIKAMAHQAFPQIPRRWLYGDSKYRSEIIPGAFKNGTALTVRQLLIDLGNDFGRKYNHNIWINNFNNSFQKVLILNNHPKKYRNIIIVPDCRRRNEFDFLKALGFFNIKILRDDCTKINDISETDQDGIQDTEFEFVIHNNGTKADLKKTIKQIVPYIHE
jgi:hypothetical protein